MLAVNPLLTKKMGKQIIKKEKNLAQIMSLRNC